MEVCPIFRRASACLLLAIALPLAAQQPPKLQPLPDIGPPPAAADRPDEPSVRIRPGASEQVEERVIDGRRVVRVSTAAGEEYYLIEDLGDGPGLRNESLDRGIRVPLWVIRRF